MSIAGCLARIRRVSRYHNTYCGPLLLGVELEEPLVELEVVVMLPVACVAVAPLVCPAPSLCEVEAVAPSLGGVCVPSNDSAGSVSIGESLLPDGSSRDGGF